MTTWIRVRSRATGHQFDIAAQRFDPDLYTKVNSPARYPDLSGPNARPRPAKHAQNYRPPPTEAVTESADAQNEE